ncbi:hypothetical protein RUND412_000584 [Rhizina undulata]
MLADDEVVKRVERLRMNMGEMENSGAESDGSEGFVEILCQSVDAPGRVLALRTRHWPLSINFLRGDCWPEVANRFAMLDCFTKRTFEDIEGKWEEFIRRGIAIKYFESAKCHREYRKLEAVPVGNDTVMIPVDDVEASEREAQIPGETNDANHRYARYTERQVRWLVNWVDANSAPGARKSWKRCAAEFAKTFGIERTGISLNRNPMASRDSPGKRSSPGAEIEEHSAELPDRYSYEQLNWIFQFVEWKFEGNKPNDEIVADAFEDEWDVKRKPMALAQMWTSMEKMARKTNDAATKKQVARRRHYLSGNGKARSGESGGNNNDSGNGCDDVEMGDDWELEEGEIRE